MQIYRTTEGPYTKDDFELTIPLNHPTVHDFQTFKHCNLPIMGIGPNGFTNPFIYFDHFLNLSFLDKIYQEVLHAENCHLIHYNKIVANGLMSSDVNNIKCIESYIANIAKYARDNAWEDEIKKLTRKGDIKNYFYEYFNIQSAWEGIAMFRKYSASYQQKTQPSEWLDLIGSFPNLKIFVESLPFKHVGYVMIFKSSKENPVLIHRDYYPTNHQVNFINFRLSPKSRPFFLYDIIKKEKVYLDPSYRSYFFNEIDPHGMDAEDSPGLTLRVEGQFTDEFKSQIGLGQNDIFNWNYEHCHRFLQSGQFYIEQSTDI
jgi:hypothetical protein